MLFHSQFHEDPCIEDVGIRDRDSQQRVHRTPAPRSDEDESLAFQDLVQLPDHPGNRLSVSGIVQPAVGLRIYIADVLHLLYRPLRDDPGGYKEFVLGADIFGNFARQPLADPGLHSALQQMHGDFWGRGGWIQRSGEFHVDRHIVLPGQCGQHPFEQVDETGFLQKVVEGKDHAARRKMRTQAKNRHHRIALVDRRQPGQRRKIRIQKLRDRHGG